MPAGPEDRAREEIDKQLTAAGWIVQDRDELNLGAGLGVAVREFGTATGPTDYILHIDRKAAGVIEAKKEGTTLSGFAQQADRYNAGLPAHVQTWEGGPFFDYESTGKETLFRDLRDPNARSRNIFTFHTPQALHATLVDGSSFRGRLSKQIDLVKERLRDCQIEAIDGLEHSLARGDPRALIQMATGAGKTFTACSFSYRLIKHFGAKRILFLVDRNNLGRQTLREFQEYRPPDDGRRFNELYGVQQLQGPTIDQNAKVVVSTIQRLFSMLEGKDMTAGADEGSGFETAASTNQQRELKYNPKIPIDTFDVIITDECHRSIYGTWRQVLDYFDAHIIGLTATPSAHTLGFFNQNLVSEYPYERSVADGVNVGYEIFRIRTEVTERGGKVDAGYSVPVIDRKTRKKTYEELDEDLAYTERELDRSVVAENQIRTVLETYRDNLPTELFPGRKHPPKTLIFAKDDNHAENIVKIARDVFGQGNDFAVKITYNAADPEALIKQFRQDYNPRIAVTVDMIATGTDVKPIEAVIFMRDVRSESYFEQMKGRGVRSIPPTDLIGVTPDAATKTRFVLIDAVGVTESAKNVSKPLERKRSVPFDKLLDQVAQGDRSDDTLATLGARLAALHHQIEGDDRAKIEDISGGLTISQLSRRVVDAIDPDVIEEKVRETVGSEATDAQRQTVTDDMKEQAARLFDDPKLRNTLKDIKSRSEIRIDEITTDKVIEAGFSMSQAAAKVQSFREFIAENQDHLTALQILLNRPKATERMTYAALDDLADALRAKPWHLMPADLWLAYKRLDQDRVRNVRTEHVLTDLIQLVRYAVSENPEKRLEPFSVVTEQRFNLWIGRQKKAGKLFSYEQMTWLELIRDHISANAEIQMRDLLEMPDFVDRGGSVAAQRVLGADMQTMLDDIAGALVA